MGGTTQDQLYDAFGAYVRSQRHLAQLTLRQVADLARISNPYLSQIEHGLVLPSISVLGALADALSVSAETMLLRAAGIVRPSTMERTSQTEHAIRHDPRLDTGQKHALLAVLSSFVASATSEAPPQVRPVDAEIPPGVADQAMSAQAPSDHVLPDHVLPDQVLADRVLTDRASSAGASSDQAQSERALAETGLSANAVRVAVRRGPLTSMSARPATASRAEGPRRKGV